MPSCRLVGEHAGDIDTATSLGTSIYFCDSRFPWQRPSNENTNGLLRQYFPKGSNLNVDPTGHLLAVEDKLNRRPRIELQDCAPIDLFAALPASLEQPAMRR